MHSLFEKIEPLLFAVEKPARYVGGEMGAQYPDHRTGTVSWLLAYPDTYEIGLPNQGLQILYEILNENPAALAERTYAPWTDMEAAMRAEGIPLFSVENHVAAQDFDVIAFNLSAELTYTNVLNMLDLGQIPIRTQDRGATDTIVLVGGHCTYNPEPMADFVDGVVLGDGEEVITEISAIVGEWIGVPPASRDRRDLHRALAGIPGVYVPSLYAPVFDGPRQVGLEILDPAAPAVIEKRTVADLGDWPYPKQQLVPLTEVVHDRLNVEVFRGCTRGCRFCQAGMITRPVRERPAAQVADMVANGLARTGYDEVALTSLSTADFSGIEDIVSGIVEDPRNDGRVSVSLPSLRVDAFTVATAASIGSVRRTGLTFAPEGGTWRMRRVINKLITDEDLFAAVEAAFSQGWRRVKLYFLIGLPTEEDVDVLGIAQLGARCVEIGKRYHQNVTVTASVGGFVPKAQTPFQWHGQDTKDELERKVAMLRQEARLTRGLQIRWHEPAATIAEGIVSRGDRRLGAVLESVWRRGGIFQEWSEHFDLERFTTALSEAGLDLDAMTTRRRDEDELLPWAHLSAGLHPDFLWGEYQDAIAEVGIEDCRWTPCYDCGACTTFGIEHVVASTQAPAGGSQGTGQGLDLTTTPVALSARPG
ncbi:MAG: TIGR03960 family B12-binding radical SAM protein [Actinomycetes bacterium]